MVRASNHVVKRFLQRTGQCVTQAEIEYRFQDGLRVEVENKVYTEARLTDVSDTLLVLLRKETNITTIVYAREEIVTFSRTHPDVECTNCGAVQTQVNELCPCPECSAPDVSILRPRAASK